MAQSRRHLKSLTLLSLGCTAAVALAWTVWPQMRDRDLSARDTLVVNGREAPRDPDLVYLAIDQESTQLDLPPERIAASPGLRLMKSPWPWSRRIYPMIIERLFAEGARVVALDLLFLAATPEDPEFKRVLDRYPDRLVIGANVGGSEREYFRNLTIAAPSDSLISPALVTDPRVGFVNFWPDVDGVVRAARYRLSREQLAGLPADTGSPPIFSLTARLLQKMGREEAVPASYDALNFRFAGPPNVGFPKHPLYEIFLPQSLRGPDFPPGFFQGKTVLVAPDGNFFHDEHTVPYTAHGGRLMPGPELHLNALNAALAGEFLRETSVAFNLLHIAGAGLVAWLLGFLLRPPVLRFFLVLAAALALFGLALLLYNAGYYLLILSPILALLSSAITFLVWEQVLERVERTRTRRTLERYVSRDVVAELLDNPATFFHALGGLRRDVTVLFTDLRGFTALTEKADSEALVTQLNEYFTEMVKHIFRHRGSLDKFMGDAIMAVFGNLHTGQQTQDVEAAIEAALGMKASLAELNQRWKQDGRPALGMGVGINHGEAIVCNLGSEQKRDFTVIGDTVNLGSRLEGLTKEYGLDFIIGEQAAELARDRFQLQLVDRVRVKGKSQPVRVYTVLGRASDPPPPQRLEYLRAYHAAMAHYTAANFIEASAGFQHCLTLQPGDSLATVYHRRCEDLRLHPVGEEWDGVYTMTQK